MGDLRRDQRAVTIAAAMAANPDKSLPQLFAHAYDLKASYNLFNHQESSPDNLQAFHRELVLEQISKPGRYLLLEDTSEMSWAGNQPIAGLGPIGTGAKGLQGFHLHSTLALRWGVEKDDLRQSPDRGAGSARQAVEVLGLADQQYHVRQPRPKGEKANDSKAMKKRERESQWWERATERIGEAPASEEVEWIRVGDRGADIYEFLRSCQHYGHRFVVRAAQDRALTDAEGRENIGKLFASLSEEKAIGEFKLELRSRPGQAGREARLQISVKQLHLRSPQRPGKGGGYLPAVKCTALRVWEANPPKGVEGLAWILLTDREVKDFWDGLSVGLIYATRWVIEEFHKALKSGTKAEQLQLERAEGLFAAIAIKSVVALRLIDLRERVRLAANSPAEEAGLEELELEILRMAVSRPIKTVKEVGLAIGRLGGHLNRKGDGMPGWQTLMRGMSKLSDLVEGARLVLKLKKFG